MGTQRESICIVVTLHESIWVGSFIRNELPGKKRLAMYVQRAYQYLCEMFRVLEHLRRAISH